MERMASARTSDIKTTSPRVIDGVSKIDIDDEDQGGFEPLKPANGRNCYALDLRVVGGRLISDLGQAPRASLIERLKREDSDLMRRNFVLCARGLNHARYNLHCFSAVDVCNTGRGPARPSDGATGRPPAR